MRIGINCLYLIPGKVGGTETYLRNILKELAVLDKENEYVLFTNDACAGTFGALPDRWKEVSCPFSPLNKFTRVYWEQFVFPAYVKKEEIDLLHSPGYVSPLRVECATVVTIHDMHYHYYPETFSFAKQCYWKHYIPRSIRKADRVLTCSENARQDIIRLAKITPDKVVAPLEAAAELFFQEYSEADIRQFMEKHKIRRPYILSVATFNRHKNLDGVVRCFNQIRARIPVPCQLILAGIRAGAYERVMAEIAKSPYKSDIKVLEALPIEKLPYLYQGAKLFLLLSYFEGFGLTVLEAMASGTAVVCSNRTSLPEIAGNASMMVDPDNELETTQRVIELLENPEMIKSLRELGLKRAREFSWTRTARETLAVYRDAYAVWKVNKK
jgi:glycosyltransferase involved in cell wall biosynthesis